ncbi:hypothetical protein D0864_16906, partial [Hortaea werneckii]
MSDSRRQRGRRLEPPSQHDHGEKRKKAVSRWDRILIFGGLNLAAVACFVICFTLLPILSLRPRKFAILWSMASALFLSSWAVMMGPMAYVRHLISQERLPFTATYFGSIVLTLYFAVG